MSSFIKDFPASSLASFNIEAQHPDTFLAHLFHLAPEIMASLIEQQAAALQHPPATPDRVLEALTLHAPEFVSRLRAYRRDDRARNA